MNRVPLPSQSRALVFFLCVGTLTLSARVIRDSFNFQFDSGGETAEFYHNDPREGAKVTWQPGGALSSLGSLKATGEVATFERYDWFRAGDDTTLSFHYLMHGYTRLEVRLNVAEPEQQQRFDRVAVHREKLCPQAEWVFVQVPVKGLPGLFDGRRSAPAGLVSKSLTFIARRANEDARQYDGLPSDVYMLVDNVRIGPPINETDIRIRQRGRHSFGTQSRTLLDATVPGAEKLLKPMEDLAILAEKIPREDSRAFKLVAAKGKPWATFEFTESLLPEWAEFDYLAFDWVSDDPALVPVCVELWDHLTTGYGSRCTYEDQSVLSPVHKGETTTLVDLRIARRNSKEGLATAELTEADKPYLDRLTKVKVWFRTTHLDADYVVYLRRIRLLQEGALDSNLKIDLPNRAFAFDIGEDSPLVEGFTEVNLLDAFGTPDSTYGFVSADGLTVEGKDWPDPLTGDYVGGGHGEDGYWRDAEFEFRAKVPNGKYLVWLNAGCFPYPDLYVDLNVNGRLLYSAMLDADTLYTRRWFYRFFDTPYSEKPNALWRDYVAKIAPVQVLETDVTNGEFFVKGMNSTLGALVLVPIAERAAFERMVSQIEAERIRFFYRDVYLDRPDNEPCRVAAPDFAMFAPAQGKSIMPWSGMDENDSEAVGLFAALGEVVPFQVAVRPFRDLGEVRMVVSDLVGTGDMRIPRERVEVFSKKYISEGTTIRNWCLMPGDRVEMEADLTRAFWFRLRIPRDATPGTYRGAIIAMTADGVSRRMPIALKVFPFALAADIPLAVGLYYSAPDGGQFVMYDRAKDFESERDRILREQMEILHDYGMTSSGVPTPNVVDLKGSGVILDMDPMAKVCHAMQATGMLANEHQMAMPYTLSVARSIAGKLRARGEKEASELDMTRFPSAYASAAMQMVNWGHDRRVPLILWVVDEPREMPNPWNRNLDDTIAHLRILGEVPGAIRMCTPMGDTNRGKDYTPLLDHLEVVATHPTPHSTNMIQRAMSDPDLGLWIYNAGRDRYSNGFYLWRVGATGKVEWHFSMWTHEKRPGRYMGSDVHNPFLNYEYNGTFVSAPLDYKGAVVPTEGLMTMSAGINDFRYLITLERSIDAAVTNASRTDAVKQARTLLATLRDAIPVIPHAKGLAKAEDLAAVGHGLTGDQRLLLDAWRGRVAQAIVALQ